MNKTKIEWTNLTWNPIKGLCPMGCYYCYARRFYRRFKWNPEIRLDEKELVKPLKMKKPKKIFACSTIELFHPDIPAELRDEVFKIITVADWHTFQVLTKLPAFVDREMPANVWLGCSISSLAEEDKIVALLDCKARLRFISLEPWMGDTYIRWKSWAKKIDWLIVGGLTGVSGPRPTKEQINEIVSFARNNKLPIFIKNNLADIWGNPLIQEFPKTNRRVRKSD